LRTPGGIDCKFFYGDYYRGREHEECRLLEASQAFKWNSKLCQTCRIPAILRANACNQLVLKTEVASLPFGIRKRVRVSATCLQTRALVSVPEVGCGHCHELLGKITTPDQ
jgi:hypothetical protein